MNTKEFLRTFRNQALTCKDCKVLFGDDDNKINIGRTGKCITCKPDEEYYYYEGV